MLAALLVYGHGGGGLLRSVLHGFAWGMGWQAARAVFSGSLAPLAVGGTAAAAVFGGLIWLRARRAR